MDKIVLIENGDRVTRIPDQKWDQIKENIENSFESFNSERNLLIQKEKNLRSDRMFKEQLSETGRRACEVVDKMRREELKSVWSGEYEESLANQLNDKNRATIHPGMMFALAKERMESTLLWKIVRKMPKGALLHAHFDAMVDFPWLFEILLQTPGIHIACSHSLVSLENREFSDLKFKFFKSKSNTNPASFWTSDYVPNSAVSLVEAAEAFPEGGRAGFLNYLWNRLTIKLDESTEKTNHGVDAIWKKFQSIFSVLSTFLGYEPIFRAFIGRMLELLHADGVRWVDLRLVFFMQYYRQGSEVADTDLVEMFRVLGEEIEKFKASEAGKGFWGARVIWCGFRLLPTRDIVEDMEACISIKTKFPHLISGYDLVGQEDPGRPLNDLLPELNYFRKRCKESNLNIPFFFHAGETLGDGTSTDLNLFDAVLLGTRRIGHGFSLFKHPLLIELIKEKRILIESCPISNEVLRLCSSIMTHPLPALLANGVHCSLCNDDPAILGQDTAGMSHDFWQALQGWENLGLAGLGSLAENSIKWAPFEDEGDDQWRRGIDQGEAGDGLKSKRLKEWKKEWEEFCAWIVSEFSEKRE
eukprot:TRINITY_DN1088_c0_g2_i1.p1 TRINITY_DN1088_c0_g2~~TRINITY_DN1088_c0_g2_i1.p1  ORF type:complete len:586 (+),score=188.09 TRINITY_DN1088_c0_g2_i1:155-1912(+)